MKSPRKTIDITKTKVPSKATTKTLEKLKAVNKVNFALPKDIDLSDCEIRITVKNGIVANFYVKGKIIFEQIVIIKPKPTPPPIHEIIETINKVRFNIK